MFINRPRIQVDFNEMVESDLVLLSKTDRVLDSDGNTILLTAGATVYLYEFNEYENGEKELLLADGVAELNDATVNGSWTSAAKWCCRIDEKGVRVES